MKQPGLVMIKSDVYSADSGDFEEHSDLGFGYDINCCLSRSYDHTSSQCRAPQVMPTRERAVLQSNGK